MQKIYLLLLALLPFITLGQDKKWVEPAHIDTTLRVSQSLAVTFSPHPAFPMEEDFLPNRIIDSLTASLENAPDKAYAIEAYQISKNPELVKRSGDQLTVKLNNSHWLTLKDVEEEPGQWYAFEHYFKELGYYSIRVMYAEGYGFLLVNANTGEMTNLIGRPYFSADGTRLVAVNNDLDIHYSLNGLQLFKNERGVLTELWHYDPEVWGSKSAIWLNNHMLILQNESIEIKGGQKDYFEFFTKLEIR